MALLGFILPILLVLTTTCSNALIPEQPPQISRRDALIGSTASLAAGLVMVSPANAAETEEIDMAALNSARAKASTSLSEMVERMEINKPKILAADGDETKVDMDKINAARSKTGTRPRGKNLFPISDPSPILTIRGGLNGKSKIKIPRVGYSFYKTAPDQAARCTSLALRSGVLHLDVGTLYNSNGEIAKSLKRYLDIGLTGIDLRDEKPEVLERLDATRLAGEEHGTLLGGGSSSILSPLLMGSLGRRGRREGLFVSHKIANAEQSTDAVAVRRSVKADIATLGCTYLDMVMMHSPLTDKARRLTTYQSLLEMRDSGFAKTVGVCNYGLGPLQEILEAGLELPAVNQLELSPFNAHKDVVDWCDKYGVAVACGAWSKLSSADGPTEGWDVVAKMAQPKGMTKAQILVRWSLQKGYICVPRSAGASKVERIGIAENSYGGVNNIDGSFVLSPEEMKILDELDVSFKAGKLGRRDGWDDVAVTGPEWDPTDFV
jgi:diketogulonate reductase-like aldo/keto reductase